MPTTLDRKNYKSKRNDGTLLVSFVNADTKGDTNTILAAQGAGTRIVLEGVMVVSTDVTTTMQIIENTNTELTTVIATSGKTPMGWKGFPITLGPNLPLALSIAETVTASVALMYSVYDN